MTLMSCLLLSIKHFIRWPLPHLALPLALVAVFVIVAALAEDAAVDHAVVSFNDGAAGITPGLLVIEGRRGWVVHVNLALAEDFD